MSIVFLYLLVSVLKVLHLHRGFDYITHILYTTDYHQQNCASLTCTYMLQAPNCTAKYYAAKQNNTNIEAALSFIHLC